MAALQSACGRGNLPLVKTLIKQGHDVNAISKKGNTALHLSVFLHQMEIAKFLISLREININLTNHMNMTPLGLAARHGNIQMVKLLVKKGAKIDSPDFENSPTFLAIKGNHRTVVKYLISEGGTIHNVDIDGNNFLIVAIASGCCEIAIDLIFSKIDVNIINSSGMTPLGLAIQANNPALARLLVMNGADVNAGGVKPIDVAIDFAGTDLVKYLIEKGARFDGECLYSSAKSGNIELVRYFDDLGINVNYQSHDNQISPLLVAVNQGHFNVVKYLRTRGADINYKFKNGRNPLLAASYISRSDIAQYLITFGADVNYLPDVGFAALHVAALNGNLELLKILLKNGGNVNISDDCGNTPLRLAVHNGHLNIVRFLIENGADVSFRDVHGVTSLHAAVDKNREDIVCCIVESGNVDKYRGVLHLAVRRNWMSLLKLCVKKGMDLNQLSAGNTPLMYAVEAGNSKICNFLKKRGALMNSEAKGKSGEDSAIFKKTEE